MPPCPISPPPPAIFVPWPWQEPLFWLIYLVLLALLVWVAIGNYRFYRNGPPPSRSTFPRHTRASLGLTLLSLVLWAICLTLLLTAASSLLRSNGWYQHEFARFSDQRCNIEPIFSVVSRLETAALTVTICALTLLFGGLAALMASLRLRGMFIVRRRS